MENPFKVETKFSTRRRKIRVNSNVFSYMRISCTKIAYYNEVATQKFDLHIFHSFHTHEKRLQSANQLFSSKVSGSVENM